MKADRSLIVIVNDRSGSMGSIVDDANGGVFNLLDEQRKQPGECFVIGYLFDEVIERPVDYINLKDLRNEALRIVPRGGTALLDAVGSAINYAGEKLVGISESERPASIQFVIVTDGQENASRKFTWAQIQDKINHQKSKYNWQFLFIGTNIDAIATASQMGIGQGQALNFVGNAKGVNAAYSSVSSKLSSYRGNVTRAVVSGQCVNSVAPEVFDQEDLKKQEEAALTP